MSRFRRTLPPYACPRCDYKTDQESNMRRHLNHRTVCQFTEHEIELTQEVKDKILGGRVIKKQTIQQIIKKQKAEREQVLANNSQTSFKSEEQQLDQQKPKEEVKPEVLELSFISDVEPLAKTTACGQPVWVLYAGEKRAPIRTIIENGQRKMHLFDFIQAMTGCSSDNVRNEWNQLQNGLDNHSVKKITESKFRFPEINRPRLTPHDSMVIDIYQATEIASKIKKRADWFNVMFHSLGARFIGGDRQLIRDVKYMNIAQKLILEHEPDNFLRLWGEEYLYNSQTAQQTQEDTNPEQIIGANTRTVKVVMGRAGITRRSINLRRRHGDKRLDLYPDAIGVIYIYRIIPRFKTRAEALDHLQKRGITVDLDDSVIICTDDLKGRILVKVGKTEFLPENRQTDYIRVLKELYVEDEQHLTEYPIKFVAKLSNVEDEVKLAVFIHEPVGLIRDNGTVYYPNEVFSVDSVELAQQIVKQTVERIQMGKPINGFDDPELTKMRETTRQLEIKSKMQTQILEYMERNNASKNYMIELFKTAIKQDA